MNETPTITTLSSPQPQPPLKPEIIPTDEQQFAIDAITKWMPPQVWDMKRGRYTAITRAAKRLTYCV